MNFLLNLIIAASWFFKLSISTEATTQVSILKTDEFTPFKILNIESLTHDTNLYRFEIPNKQSIYLPVTSTIKARKPVNGTEQVVRSYTLVSDENQIGYFDLIIKLYPNGNLTSYINTLNVNDTLEFKGPFNKFIYQPNTFEEVGLVAGGTGIAPMVHLIRKIFKDPTAKTKISLVFANKKEEDIILRTEFDGYAKDHPDRFKVYYVLSQAPEGWQGGIGRINTDILRAHLPKLNSKIFVCGSKSFLQSVAGLRASHSDQGEPSGMLLELGYKKEEIYKY